MPSASCMTSAPRVGRSWSFNIRRARSTSSGWRTVVIRSRRAPSATARIRSSRKRSATLGCIVTSTASAGASRTTSSETPAATMMRSSAATEKPTARPDLRIVPSMGPSSATTKARWNAETEETRPAPHRRRRTPILPSLWVGEEAGRTPGPGEIEGWTVMGRGRPRTLRASSDRGNDTGTWGLQSGRISSLPDRWGRTAARSAAAVIRRPSGDRPRAAVRSDPSARAGLPRPPRALCQRSARACPRRSPGLRPVRRRR